MIIKVLNKILSLISGKLRFYRGKKFADQVEQITDKFHRVLNNVNFDMKVNGEIRMLRIIAESNPKCIFDVGANNGEWCHLVSDMNQNAIIHSFEIVPETYKMLVQEIKDLKNVIPNNFGLSDMEEDIYINMGEESGTATAFKIEGMKFHNEYYKEKIPCKVRKATDYIKQNKISAIDFVKIDVEGMDLRVIKGFEDDIRIVKVIQFEYGIFNISSHDLLSDFYNYLTGKGFVIGKIFPHYVNFFEYHFNMENFHGSNFIAVRSEEKELIKKLSTFKYWPDK